MHRFLPRWGFRQADSNFPAQMPQYTYDSLPTEGEYFRLLRLLPGRKGSSIFCQLEILEFKPFPEPYVAVSYTWGAADTEHMILSINGALLPVRNNLFKLLSAFRKSAETVTLWVDAVCIDQSSLDEKNHQVQLMGRIFRRARCVNAWLGSMGGESDRFFEELREVIKILRSERWPLPEYTGKLAKQVVGALQRQAYWGRAWIVQELVLAQEIIVCARTETIPWQDVISVVSMTDKEIAPTIRAIEAMRSSRGQRSFQDLFSRFGHLQCSLPHDKFYSLYAMVDDNDPQIVGGSLPRPDYSLCVTEVFMQQLQRWEYQPQVQSPMDFIATFRQYLKSSEIDKHFSPCKCHRDTFVSMRFPVRGTVVEYTASSFSIHNSNDIYRFRRFRPGCCDLKEGDLAFHLGQARQTHNIIVRPYGHDSDSAQNTKTEERTKVVSLVYYGDIRTYCFTPEEALLTPLYGTEAQLNAEQDVLTMKMTASALMTLADFIM
ncbi:MAG: hypothetical protein Q9227_000511 [Pyrenula ochraceoflavens]